MTFVELIAARAAAGERYAAAIAELQTSYVELAAIDRVFAMGNTPGEAVPTYRGDADRIGWEWRHPIFYPEAGPSLLDAVASRAERLAREIGAR